MDKKQITAVMNGFCADSCSQPPSLCIAISTGVADAAMGALHFCQD